MATSNSYCRKLRREKCDFKCSLVAWR